MEQTTRFFVSLDQLSAIIRILASLARDANFQYRPEVLSGPEGGMVASTKREIMKPGDANDQVDAKKASEGMRDALRQAYEETLEEAIPDDLLALLSKLD